MYIINRTQRHKNFKNLIKVKNVMIISTENDTFVIRSYEKSVIYWS